MLKTPTWKKSSKNTTRKNNSLHLMMKSLHIIHMNRSQRRLLRCRRLILMHRLLLKPQNQLQSRSKSTKNSKNHNRNRRPLLRLKLGPLPLPFQKPNKQSSNFCKSSKHSLKVRKQAWVKLKKKTELPSILL